MPIQRINEFPEGSGSLSNDDVFLFMDDPSGSGVTKKISLSQISSAIGGGGGGGNPFDQDLNTNNSPVFDTISITGVKIYGGGTDSGDGNGYSTLELVPDSGLYSGDQYLVVDPTGPNHIHLRAGGSQDSSGAELILGGEKNNVVINDNNGVTINNTRLVNNDYYYSVTSDFTNFTWIEESGNYFIQFVTTNPDMINKFWDSSNGEPNNQINVNDQLTDYYADIIQGSHSNPSQDTYRVQVSDAPPVSLGTVTQIFFRIYTTQYNNIQLTSSDFRVDVKDDIRMYSRDAFRLYNYSTNAPIEIITNYDDSDNTWYFNADGNLEIPGNINLTNNTSLAKGTFDNGTSGQNGISLNCAVGYELNWQGGHLKSTTDGGLTASNILCDSAIEFEGSGVDNVELNSTGLIFSDGSTQITAYTGVTIPVTDIVSGTFINVSSVSGVYTINSTGEASVIKTSVFNKTGNQIPKFSVVYINGGQGDQPTISLAVASGEITSSKTYGITAENIDNMAAGHVVVMGALTGLNTDQFNPTAPTGNVNGVSLWLSPSTPGGVTTTKPSAPNHAVYVGTIVRTHQNQGVVEVRIQNGYELEELHNVAISGVQDNQILMYDSATQLWKNETPSFGGSTTVVSGVFATTYTTNASSGDIFDLTLTDNITLANPTNGINGQTIRWRLTQDNTGNRAISLGNKFKIPSSATDPLPWSTSGNAMDILAATYHSGRDKWDVVAFVPGY